MARVRSMVDYHARRKVACLYYAAYTSIIVTQLGRRCILQAGSASFLYKPPADDDGGANSYAYTFDPSHPLSVANMAAGGMPEMHCWAAIVDDKEIVDLTTRYMPDLLTTALPDQRWTAPVLDYFWGTQGPDGWYYEAALEAVMIAYALIFRGHPDLFYQMQLLGIAPDQRFLPPLPPLPVSKHL